MNASIPPLGEPPEAFEGRSRTVGTYDPSVLDDRIDLWGWKGLTIVGTGIRAGLQKTPEAKVCIEQASKVLYLVGDPVSEAWLRGVNPNAESLFPLYAAEKPRKETYAEIVERIMEELHRRSDVCVVFYGHPGVLVGPTAEVTKRARSEGYPLRILPGVSALDNLFADLRLDPGITGLQTYEATAFVLYEPRYEPTAALVLWQIGVLGERRWMPHSQPNPDNLRLLQRRLLEFYPPDHRVVIYETSVLPFTKPVVIATTVSGLADATFSTSSTLFAPPLPRSLNAPVLLEA